jgi:ferric-dicitrate binding protein FerR (iron transport regulator)
VSADRAPPPAAALDDLIVRYWDDDLSPEELGALNRALAASADARAVFREYCLQALAIGEQFAVERVAATAGTVAGAARPAAVRRAWVPPAVIAALLVAAGVVVWARRDAAEAPPPEPAAIARVEDFTGLVRVSGGDGDTAPALPDQPLYSGQTVTLAGHDGSAGIRFTDGTRLVLYGDTAVQVADGDHKVVRVSRGNVAADVRPQPPDRPMILATPAAEVRVLGTKLSLSETNHKTEVAVVRGEVRLTRLSDRQSVDLSTGQVATAVRGSKKLLLSRLTDLPDSYTMDLERVPADWGAGERIFDGLPPGSRVGMRAAPYNTPEFGTQYQVRSQNAWTAGLFELHPDSWLHVRFRADRARFFHVLLVARGDDPTNKRGVVFEAPQFWQRRPPGEWHEVSVPLARVKVLGKSPPEYQLPLVVYKVIVNSHLDDVGLAIDRLRVTRGPDPR